MKLAVAGAPGSARGQEFTNGIERLNPMIAHGWLARRTLVGMGLSYIDVSGKVYFYRERRVKLTLAVAE